MELLSVIITTGAKAVAERANHVHKPLALQVAASFLRYGLTCVSWITVFFLG
jgi:hypothetical protein